MKCPHFIRTVVGNFIGGNFGDIPETPAHGILDFFGQMIGLEGEAEVKLVHFEGIIVGLAQFELPATDTIDIVENDFQFIEVDQDTLEFIQFHPSLFGYPGDTAEQAGKSTATGRAWCPGQSAFGEITGAVAQDHGASGIHRGINNFTGGFRRQGFAGLGVDNFDQSKFRRKVIAGGRFFGGDGDSVHAPLASVNP